MNTLIITGGSLNISWATEYLNNKTYDCIITADSGLKHAKDLNILPTIILGDFDSLDEGIIDSYRSNNILVYPREKDYTDTHLAILTALEQESDSITILGATGTRLDHMLTSIGNLKLCTLEGVYCEIVDEYNRISLLCEGVYNIKKNEQYGDYISLVPMTETVILSLHNMKYPLDKYELHQGLSICQSNEIIEDIATITVHSGLVYLFESKD